MTVIFPLRQLFFLSDNRDFFSLVHIHIIPTSLFSHPYFFSFFCASIIPPLFFFCIFDVSKFPSLFFAFLWFKIPPHLKTTTLWNVNLEPLEPRSMGKKKSNPTLCCVPFFESQYPHASFFIPTPLYFCILGVSKFPPLIFPFLWFPPHLNSARSIVNLEPLNPRSTDPKSAIRTHMQNSNPHLPKI